MKNQHSVSKAFSSALGNATNDITCAVSGKGLKVALLAAAVTGAAKFCGNVISSGLSKIPLIGKALGSVLSTPFNLVGRLFIPVLILAGVFLLVIFITTFFKHKRSRNAIQDAAMAATASTADSRQSNMQSANVAEQHAERIDSFD